VQRSSFNREVFSSTYLTIIGIIQAAVFTYLIKDTIAYTSVAFTGLTFFELVAKIMNDIYMWQVFATFGAILIITFEYSFFVLLFYRPIAVFDIAILFLIGIVEFYIAAHVGEWQNWWKWNVAFAVAGQLAFLNTLSFNLQDIFGDDKARKKIARWHTVREMLIVAGAGVYAFVISIRFQDGALQNNLDIYLTAVWPLFFGAMMLGNSSHYINRMTRSPTV
jgi:hypothetical protein